MKIRPADFSKSILLSEPAIFSSGRFSVSWNNSLYEIIYKILLQDSMMFSGVIRQRDWFDESFDENKTQNLFGKAEA